LQYHRQAIITIKNVAKLLEKWKSFLNFCDPFLNEAAISTGSDISDWEWHLMSDKRDPFSY
jgi:hypothetical protein